MQTGTEKVVAGTEKYKVIQCKCCRAMFDNSDDFNWHTNPANSDAPEKCWWSASVIFEKKREITENQPVYENKWVEDTIRICEICGQQEPS